MNYKKKWKRKGANVSLLMYNEGNEKKHVHVWFNFLKGSQVMTYSPNKIIFLNS